MATLAAAAALSCAAPARAVATVWVCENDLFDSPSCWSSGAIPGAPYNVYITSPSAQVGFGLFTPAVTVRSINIGASTGTATLSIPFGSLAASDHIFVGSAGTGEMNSGTRDIGGVLRSIVTTSTLYVGQSPGSSGTYNQSLTGSLTVSNNLDLAGSGTGTFNQTGGSVQVSRLDMAWGVSAPTGTTGVALYNMQGGSFSAGQARVAVDGTGTFNQTGGSAAVSGSLLLTATGRAQGSYTLSGGTLFTDALDTGSGYARFDNLGGTHTASSILIGSNGGYALNGGVLNVGGVALSGDGSLIVSAGELHATGSVGQSTSGGQILHIGGIFDAPLGMRALDITIGSQASFSNVAGSVVAVGDKLSNNGRWTNAGGLVDGPGVFVNNGSFVGHGEIKAALRNQGALQQDAGSLVLSNAAYSHNYGNWAVPFNATLEIAAGGLRNMGTLQLQGSAVKGAGVLSNETGGTVSGSGTISSGFTNAGRVVINDGTLGFTSAISSSGMIVLNSAAATLTGPHIINTGRIEGQGQIAGYIGNAGTIEAKSGTLTVSASLYNTGSLRARTGGTLVVDNPSLSNYGRIELAGGEFDTNGGSLQNDATGRITGYGTLRARSIGNAGQLQMSGGVSDMHGAFTNLPGAAVLLSGNSNTTFYDDTQFQAGSELRVSTGSVATFFGNTIQRSGALFSGTGAKFFEGTFSIGASPGLGIDAGDVSFGVASRYTADIGGLAAGAQFDHYSVSGALHFGGTLKLTSWAGYVAQAGDRFDLFDWGSESGSFSAIDSSGLILADGLLLDTARLYIDGTVGIQAVPEPQMWLLMLMGLPWVAAQRTRWKPSNRHPLCAEET